MNKIFKRLTAIILCAAMLIAVAPMSAFAAEERKTVDSGFCGVDGGENLTWTLYDDGELVISGEGDMDWYYVDYYSDNPLGEHFPPWYDYYKNIDVITVEEGVESIGNDAFAGDNIGYYKVNLPKSLKYYDSHPFRVNHRNCKIGQYCVLNYAGTQEEWNAVEQRQYAYSLNAERTAYTRRRVNGSAEAFNDFIYRYGTRHYTVTFNSQDMQPTVKLTDIGLDRIVLKEIGEFEAISLYYYNAGIEDAKIRWSVSGDSVSYTPRVDEASGLETSIALVAEKYGEPEIKAELVGADGTVLASDSVKIKVYIPEGMNVIEKTKYYAENAFLYMGGYGLYFSFAFGLFLEMALMAPAALISYIAKGVKGLF